MILTKNLISFIVLFLMVKSSSYGQAFNPEYRNFTKLQSDSTLAPIVPLVTHPYKLSNELPLTKATAATIDVSTMSSISSPNQVPNKLAVVTTNAVGEIPVQQTVAPNGAFNYSVPIECVPGRNGFQPSISLSYNSMGGNGVAGVGWSIAGLSVVARTGSTYYYDGKTAADNLSSNLSNLTLDGMRLISTGINVFESEQGYIRVEQVVGSCIKYFKVSYPNGSVGILGYESNATQQLIYPLTKLTDAVGRTITYTYTSENNQYYISQIIYGASTGSTENFASIKFTYKNRSDVGFNYVSGRKITENKLLDKIECLSGSTIVRTYTFTYEGGNQSKLKQIDCAVGTKKLNPLIFYYGSGTNSPSLTSSDCMLTASFQDTDVKDLVIGKGKIDPWSDDDGLIVYPYRPSYAYITREPSLFLHSQNRYVNSYNPTQQIAFYVKLKDLFVDAVILTAGNGFIKAFALNVDNTPDDEVIRVNHNVESEKDVLRFKIYKAFVSLGTPFLKEDRELTYTLAAAVKDNDNGLSVTPRQFLTGDFNGDGRNDVFAISRYKAFSNNNYLSTCHLFSLYDGTLLFSGQVAEFNCEEDDYIFGMDYDGDGKTDICLINNNGTYIYTFNGTTFVKSATISDLKKDLLKSTSRRSFLVGDINGDGKTDLLLSPPASYYYSWYDYIPVATRRSCPYCGGEYPGYGVCKYCSKTIPDAPICYSCNSLLKTCDSWSSQKCCSRCGTEVYAEIRDYVNYGNKWTTWFAKGADGFEKIESSLFNHEENNNYLLQDMNKDGKADLVRLDLYGTIYIYKAINGGISPNPENSYEKVSPKSIMIPSIVANREYHSQLLALSTDKKTVERISFSQDETQENLLTGVANSLGVITKVTYVKLSGDGYYNYPPVFHNVYTKGIGAIFPYENFNGPLFVAAQTEVWNNDKQYDKATYRYTNAIIHRQGLGFRGFEKFASTDNSGRETVLTFNPLQFCLPLTETNDMYSSSSTYSVNVATNKKATIRLTKTVQTDKLNNNTITTTYTHDSYGNVTQETSDYGGGMKTVSDQTYSNQTASLYILGLPLINTVTQYRNGTTLVSNDATWVEKTEKEYFANTLPKTIKTYVNGNKTTENQFTYDASGNLLTEKTIPYSSTDVFEKSYTYDTKQRYLLTEKDEYGKTTTFAGHNYFNQPGTVKDFKNNTTTYTYDELGNVIKTVFPDGVTKDISYTWNVSADKVYAVTNTTTGQPKQTAYFDAFNRDVQTNMVSFNGTEVNTQKIYDEYGKLWKESEPSFGTASRWTIYSYDKYNRITQVALPTGKSIKYTYGQNTVKTEDADRITTVTKDASGAVLKINDAAGDIVYTLRPDGQPSVITAPNGSKTEFTFDNYGRKTKLVDPSAGTLQYAYNTNGYLDKQTDALNTITETVYDKYGRPTKMEIKNGITNGQLSTDNGIIQISTNYTYNADDVLISVSGGGKTTTYTYDNLLRITSDKEEIAGIALTRSYTYSAGKVQKITYSGLSGTAPPALEYVYNTYGYLSSVKSADVVIKTVNSKNNLGQTTQYTLGNGVVVTRAFDANSMPTEIKTVKGAFVLQHFTYAIDAQRNTMAWRKDNLRNLTETFTYDKQYRLTQANSKVIAAYDAMGNITSKADAGTMEYKVTGKPYAISNLTTNPSTIPVRQQDITYNGMQRPTAITENNIVALIAYGHDYSRYKMEVEQINTSGLKQTKTLQYTRYYLSDCYEKDVNVAGITTERLYFNGTPYNANLVYTRTGTGAWVANYIHRDHLGSITAITDGNGNKTAEYSFDPWGRQRDPATQVAYAPDKAPALLLARGYTGHEHLPQFGLVNMNARLYDPVLGRFLSPDPHVQAPDWSQNFNRYSYCVNNPLMYTDEDGEFFFGILNFVKDVFVNTFIKVWSQGFNAWTDGSNWQSTAMGFKVDWGLWKGNPLQIFSRFTWELPQTFAGYMFSGFNVTTYNAKSVTYYGGATVVETYWNKGAVTLGSFINGRRGIQADPNNSLFQHEYGHYLQSQAKGWLYLGKYALPSLYSADNDDNYHDLFPVEQDANARALGYFTKRYGDAFADNQVDGIGWNFRSNPIRGYNISQPYADASNQAALQNAKIGFSGLDLLPLSWIPGNNFIMSIFYYRNYPKYPKNK